MNILDAIRDEKLFRPFLGKKLRSWRQWLVALRCLYGLPLKEEHADLIRECTGREPEELPQDGFRSALFLTGRRSGKSRTAAVVAGFESLFGGHERKLAPGEVGLVAVVSPTQRQSGICWGYLRALFDSSPILRAEVVDETPSAKLLTLRNGLQVAVIAGDPKRVRGFTLCAAIVDEAAFFGLDPESSVRSDVELIRSIRPSLATTGGRLIAISSPYAKKGYCFTSFQRYHGSNKGKVSSFSPSWNMLVWRAASRTMNPLLPQSVVDEAMIEDAAAARSEYLGEFRDDVCEFVPRSLVESLVVQGRKELLPRAHEHYCAFVDLSGGRHDDAALAIAHREGRKVILDHLCVWRVPFAPISVVSEMSKELRRWRIRRVTGDNYAGDFGAGAFASSGIAYHKSEYPKSQLYRELLPRLCSGEVELLDNDKLISQLASLERRTRAGGNDIVDHPPNGKDDAANAVAGVIVHMGRNIKRAGGLRLGGTFLTASDPFTRMFGNPSPAL